MEKQAQGDLASTLSEHPAEHLASVARGPRRHFDRLAIQMRDARIVALQERLHITESRNTEMLAALQDCAKVINAMHMDKLPPCFKPTLEMVNNVNGAIARATGSES